MIRQKALYLIRASNGLHKIGIAYNPKGRFADLCNVSPVRLWLVHASWPEDAGRAERDLHVRFAAKRHHGEWFQLNAQDVAEIIRLYPAMELTADESSDPLFDQIADRVRRLALRSNTAHFIFRRRRAIAAPFGYSTDRFGIPQSAIVIAAVTCRGGIHRRGPKNPLRSIHATPPQ